MSLHKGLSGNALKLVAILAMTIDHVAWMVFPGYSTEFAAILCHVIGRVTAPIMWFFIAEGFHYTKSIKNYAKRLFIFAVISHFAYNFAFDIPFIPCKTSIFNQTSIFWALAWGLVALAITESKEIKQWVKVVSLVLICVITFPSDWSCIAVLCVVFMGVSRGDFKMQMKYMVMFVFMYALVYFFFIDRLYGMLQMGVVLAIPILKMYNGERGTFQGMKWFFYIYYPLHLLLCGVLRILIR